MTNADFDLNDAQLFAQVVELGSFSAAARNLGLPVSSVSRKVARLEDQLGSRLLHRTTRKQGLTDAGSELFPHARSILSAVREAQDALKRQDGTPRGLLRVSMPPAEPLGGRHE